MNIEEAASKVGIFDIKQNQKNATKQILKNKIPTWYLEDKGLRFAVNFGTARCSMSKLLIAGGRNLEHLREHGFDIHARDLVSIKYSSTLITKHALHRWEERAKALFPNIKEIYAIDEAIAASAVNKNLFYDINTQEYFYPFGSGAFIIEQQMFDITDFDTISKVKKNANYGNYQYSKSKKSWVGEFMPRGSTNIVKTYLSDDELKAGGKFNRADWYKENFRWQEEQTNFNNKMKELEAAE